MKKKKTDLRVLRTKKMIMEAFIKLVEEKGLDQVTVQDIASQAMINRATFYAHYKDKQDLYDQIFEYAFTTFSDIIEAAPLMEKNRIRVKRIERVLTNIYQNIHENREFFLTLTQSSSLELLRQRLAQLIAEKYANIFAQLRITENEIEVPIDFIIEYMTSIFIGTLHWWIHTDSDMTPKHLAQLVIKLVGNGHLTVMGLEIDRQNN
ncbi:TetR/AcrR family transcriptional regulator [Enterococcus hirae]|nr:TetR/AcrR family transcriptional regulator [Enterococcus hirae]